MANAQETLASWRAHPTLKLIVFDICLPACYRYVLLLRVATRRQDADEAHRVLLALAEDELRPSRANTVPAIAAWFASPAAPAPIGWKNGDLL